MGTCAGAVTACSSGGTPTPAASGFHPADVQRTIDTDLPRSFPGLRFGPGAAVRLAVTVSDKNGSYTFQPEQDS